MHRAIWALSSHSKCFGAIWQQGRQGRNRKKETYLGRLAQRTPNKCERYLSTSYLGTGGRLFREYCFGEENSLSLTEICGKLGEFCENKNSVSSHWHTNNRLRRTHWALPRNSVTAENNSLSSVFEAVLSETVFGLFRNINSTFPMSSNIVSLIFGHGLLASLSFLSCFSTKQGWQQAPCCYNWGNRAGWKREEAD